MVWLLCTGLGRAQPALFVGYTVKDGLNDNHITGICQDSRGFYWISSHGGLNRFDGKFFEAYFPGDLANDIGLTDNAHVLFECRPNVLMVTVDNGRLFELDAVFPSLTPVPAFKHRIATDFYRVNAGCIAIGCLDTVFLVDNHLQVLGHVSLPTKPKGLSLKARPMGQNRYLLNNWKEQYIWNSRSGQLTELKYGIGEHDYIKSGFDVLHIDTGNRWIYIVNYFRGLYKLDYTGRVLFNWSELLPPEYRVARSARQLLPDPQNDSLVWLAGDNGLTHLNIYTHKTRHYLTLQDAFSSATANLLLDIYLDRGGKLWAVTNQGLFAQGGYSSIRAWGLGLSDDVPPMTIMQSREGYMYLSKYYDGVYRIHPQTGREERFDATAMDGSWFIFEDGDNLIQGGKGTTLTYHNQATGQISRNTMLDTCFAGSEVVVMGFRHSNGDLWFSANGGGGLARVKGTAITHYSAQKGHFSHSYLTHHAEAPNGDLWLSANKTPILLHWLRGEDRFEEMDFGDLLGRYGIYRSVIHCVATGADGSVWLGFDGSGLLRFHPQRRNFILYTKKNGLPSNFVYNLVFDGRGRLWVGTRNGLACLEPAHNRLRAFHNANGFPADRFDNSCAYFDTGANQLWIGANDRLLAFDPDLVLGRNLPEPGLFVDAFVVNNHPVDIRNAAALRLAPQQNNLHIGFATLNHRQTGDVVYSYSLAGTAGPWVELGTSRQVNFPNLGYGQYEFMLRGKVLGNPEWFYLQAPIRFSIATPWYRSRWFSVLLGLATLGLIFIITRTYYAAKVQKQKSLMEKQLAIQTERDRISFDMHDDLGSGLTKISYLSQMAMNKGGQSPELEKIKHTSQELVGNMSELIWAMKAENDNLTDMLGYLRGYAFDYLGANAIEVAFTLPEHIAERTVLGEKRRHIFLIYKEALHNIVKHAKAKNVSISLRIDSHLQLKITDDGQGFDATAQDPKKGNGLRSMASRTQKLNGSMEVQTALKEGTVLVFRFPMEGLS